MPPYFCAILFNMSHFHRITISHVDILMLHAVINKLNVNKIMLHVDIIYLACRGQKYAPIYLFEMTIFLFACLMFRFDMYF